MKANLLKEKQKLNKNEIGIKLKEKSGFRFKLKNEKEIENQIENEKHKNSNKEYKDSYKDAYKDAYKDYKGYNSINSNYTNNGLTAAKEFNNNNDDNDVLYERIKEKLEKKQHIYEKLKSCDKDAEIINFSDEENINIPMKNMTEKFLFEIESDKYSQSNFILKHKKEINGNNLQSHKNTIKQDFTGETETKSQINNSQIYSSDGESKDYFSNIAVVPKVKQSYDKVLSEGEKKALNLIKSEENEYKKNLEFLRKKKNKEREERLERIKKMKID